MICNRSKSLAGVAEWQTRQTQNLLFERVCEFESRHRHMKRECFGSHGFYGRPGILFLLSVKMKWKKYFRGTLGYAPAAVS